MSASLTAGEEDNVITLLVWNEKYAPLLAELITPDLFANRDFRTIAERSIEYIERYHRPPGLHIRDLLEHELSRAKTGDLLLSTLDNMRKHQAVVQPEYVMEGIDKFVRVQRKMAAMDVAYEALRKGDETTAEDALWKGGNMTARQTVGTWLHDDDLGFLTPRDEDFFSIGIEELDKRDIRPYRGTVVLFIAPKKRGKSWKAVAVGKAGLQHRHTVLHITLENSEALTKRRYIQAFFGMTKRAAQSIQIPYFVTDADGSWTATEYHTVEPIALVLENQPEILRRVRSLRSRPRLLIKAFPTGALTVPRLETYMDSLRREHNFEPDLLIIDYPDLMNIDANNLRIETGRTYQQIRGLAVDRDMAAFCPSQGNRSSDGARYVTSRMVAEDFSKTGIADTILTYSQTPEERQKNLARILVDAARDAEDQYTVLISQSYATGQFCVDSVFMNKVVAAEIDRITRRDEVEEPEEERDEVKHGERRTL